MALSDTQTRFYALDMENINHNFSIDDSFNIKKLSIADADEDKSLYGMVSTFDHIDQVIRDGYYDEGRKVVTFANILKHEMFPLAKILDMMLNYGKDEMGRPVEIEFAGNLKGGENNMGEVYWLQIRPIVDMKEMREDEIDNVKEEDILVKSSSALGHGIHE